MQNHVNDCSGSNSVVATIWPISSAIWPRAVNCADGYQPGIGIEFHPEAPKRYPFEMEELPGLRREDGSFTNS